MLSMHSANELYPPYGQTLEQSFHSWVSPKTKRYVKDKTLPQTHKEVVPYKALIRMIALTQP